MQLAVVEIARNVFNKKDANSTEFNSTKTPIVSLMTEWINNDKIEVASTHHQGIRDLGSNLIPVAWSDDGLIEAIEDSKSPNSFLAVQWHPELMPNNIDQKKLFSWLTSEAIKRS